MFDENKFNDLSEIKILCGRKVAHQIKENHEKYFLWNFREKMFNFVFKISLNYASKKYYTYTFSKIINIHPGITLLYKTKNIL